MNENTEPIHVSEFDVEQAQKQLNALLYDNNETVFLRAFYPQSNSKSKTDKGRKTQAQCSDLPVQQIEDWQKEGRGIYFVVNGGGHQDKDVNSCRAIFYEHDDLDKEISARYWQSLRLPEPTFQVDTGGKSIHSYWVLNEPIPPEQWRELQRDLIEAADGDRSLKNPSRVMRLAGAIHPVTKKKSVFILNAGDK